MDELAAAAVVPVVPMELDPEEGVALASDAVVQENHSGVEVSDGVVALVPSQVVDDPFEREGNGPG